MKLIITFLSFVLLILTGCGTTSIITNASYTPDFYVNGQFAGKGSATITRMGPPKKVTISVKYRGEEVGNLVQKRKFDGVTCLCGYLSYGIGLFTAWRFPAVIVVPVAAPAYTEESNPWTNPRKSKWMEPQTR